MSTLTITSPGVQINEEDLSLITNTTGSTNILAVGFAPQGPTNELINISSISEYESVFGLPSNAAERYLYHSSRQILNSSPANLNIVRLPYGTGVGNGYTSNHSALVYPISTNAPLFANATSYTLLEPVSILLNDSQYAQIKQNNITWGVSPYVLSSVNILSATVVAYGSQASTASAVALSSYYVQNFVNPTDVSSVSYNATTSAISLSFYPHVASTVTLNLVPSFSAISSSYTLSGYTNTFVGNTTSNITFAFPNYNGTNLVVTPNYILSSSLVGAVTANSTITGYTTAYNGSYYNTPITGFDGLSSNFSAGLIVINESKTSVDNLYEGYYVGIASNQGNNPATNFTSITGVKAVYQIDPNGVTQDYLTVPPSRFAVASTTNYGPLTSTYNNFGPASISQIVESFPTGYNFGSVSFQDSLSLVLFKVNTSTYNQDTIKLSYSVAEGYVGSLYSQRTQNNPNGGAPVTFFLDRVVNNASNNISVCTNPFISSNGNWTGTTNALNQYVPPKQVTVAPVAQNLYSSGLYQSQTDYTTKDVGNIPSKLQNVLNRIQNDDTIQLDITIEAGLGTIWCSVNALSASLSQNGQTGTLNYDETYNYQSSLGISADYASNGTGTGLYDITQGSQSGVAPWATGSGADYLSVAQQFVSLANDTRKDHIFIADPIRHLLIQGSDSKVLSNPGFVFSNDIYWPLNNQFGSFNSSYVTTYANWIKYNDATSNKLVWIPSSGYAAAKMATTFQQNFPWSAVAGFTRGVLDNVVDLAINPTQKQRDLLYKVNLNPIAFFPNEGYVIYGQKTLYRTPSAFDRINVRELFLSLEKQTQALLKYFVFEPNTYTTQTRLIAALKPLFDNAKINQGLYDYLIVCDSRNNTPDIIDNNQLKVSIYIQPVKTAEFILCDFIATQTGVDFTELVANNQF